MENFNLTIIVITNDYGVVKNINQDDLNTLTPGKSLLEIVDSKSIPKLLSFLNELKKEGNVLGWEINFTYQLRIRNMFVFGACVENGFSIVASTDILHSKEVYDDLVRPRNECSNEAQKVISDMKLQALQKQSEEAFNHMTLLNNKVINIQRELLKKNIELERVNEDLETKNRELDQFAHIVSHDLKAPLRGIYSLLSVITESYHDQFSIDAHTLFAEVVAKAKGMDNLINAILTYSKAGSIDNQITTFKLSDSLAEILNALVIPEGIHVKIPKFLPEITGSEIQLRQVLANLLGNAIKYHDKTDGFVELKLHFDDPFFIFFSIVDNGPGIPEEYHNTLFDMFETTEQSDVDSTGVGLAIVKKLVDQNAGELGLNSTVGKGSEFWFKWPKIIEQE